MTLFPCPRRMITIIATYAKPLRRRWIVTGIEQSFPSSLGLDPGGGSRNRARFRHLWLQLQNSSIKACEDLVIGGVQVLGKVELDSRHTTSLCLLAGL